MADTVQTWSPAIGGTSLPSSDISDISDSPDMYMDEDDYLGGYGDFIPPPDVRNDAQ